jgi:hypothetical protein
MLAAAPAPQPLPGLTVARTESVAPKALRGYGTLSGEFAAYSAPSGAICSLLAIKCDSEAKAKLVHAKYVSDLRLILPVTETAATIKGMSVPIAIVPDQGAIAAFRVGTVVNIAAATDRPTLEKALNGLATSLARAELKPTATIPPFLDSWDKHGFSFYYRAGTTPPTKPGEKRIQFADYHVLGEFDFAKKNSDSGMVFWATENMCDFADGLTNENMWQFGAKAAQNRGVPFTVNTSSSDPTWLSVRYPDDIQWKMPGYSGGYYSGTSANDSAKGHIAWSAGAANTADLAVMQKYWRKYAAIPEAIEYLEPHAELRHGAHDLLNEYGPAADRTFRAYLKGRYTDTATLSRRWYGKPDSITNWDSVHVPELTHFFGGDKPAFDLTGDWRTQVEPYKTGESGPTNPAPDEWYKPALDDSAWPTVLAPGNDAQSLLQHRPAVWRRHFDLPAEWLAGKQRVWLYVFSLNRAAREKNAVYLNGKKIAEPVLTNAPSIVTAEVTGTLVAGQNLLALRLPDNMLSYRAYLTDKEPATYPYLGEQMNAQWVDFIRWEAFIRGDAIRRSFEAIRQVEPDKSVICMSPDSYITQVERVCQEYGGHFHNTGYMGGWWHESLPMMMRAADMPFSVEPGNPAANLTDFKNGLGMWLTEGVNAVHYFIHVGDVYWNDEICKWFEDNQSTIGIFGKAHVPKAQVAMLYGDDINNLTDWPWNANISGAISCQFNVALHKDYHMDGVSVGDIERGIADPYRVIIDTNSRIMDDSTVAAIEKWVSRGGVFVALQESGRNTPEKADSWPISRLTGYRVASAFGHPVSKAMQFAPGQQMFVPAHWDETSLRNNGNELDATATDCIPLMLWPDGKTAVGMRKVGQGTIITVGCAYTRPSLLPDILASMKIAKIPGYADLPAVNSTHEVSNNGLYDIWITANFSNTDSTTALKFNDGVSPLYAVDLHTNEKLTPVVDGGQAKLAGLTYAPRDIRIFAAPRRQIATAPLDWFNLQRGWWSGATTPPQAKPLEYKPDNIVDLDTDWRMKPLDDTDTADHTALAAPALDDTTWKAAVLNNWIVPEDLPTHKVMLRRKFTVPATWTNGHNYLWLKAWQDGGARGKCDVWLDGARILQGGREFSGQDMTTQLKPGSHHTLAIETSGAGEIAGFGGDFWLNYIPNPTATINLAGTWDTSRDGLTWGKQIPLPGPWQDVAMARRTVNINQPAGQTVMFWADDPALTGIIVNGHWVRRHHHRIGQYTYVNVTPWVKFGQDNRLEIPYAAGSKGATAALELRFLPTAAK